MSEMNQIGWVSIWVFLRPELHVNDVLKDIFGIDNYDIDAQDVVGEEDWSLLPIAELLRRLSYSSSFAEVALGIAQSRGLESGRRALAQYNFKFDPSEAPPPVSADPLFLGAVPYDL